MEHLRVARQPRASFDSHRGRLVINWRIPRGLQALLSPEVCARISRNGKWYRDRFPQNASPEQAARLEAERLVEYHAIIDGAREALASPERRSEVLARLADKAAGMMLAQGDRLIALQAGMRKLHDDRESVGRLAALGVVMQSPETTPGGKPITIDEVVRVWSNEYRQNDEPLHREPSDSAKAAKAGVLLYMFETLKKPDDMRQITAADLRKHRAYLIGDPRPGKKGRKPNVYDHIQQIITCFNAAERNGLLTTNPAEKLQNVNKDKGKRPRFTEIERIAVLRAALECEPDVKWAHWISGCTSAIPSELRFLTPGHFYIEDGYKVVDIKPPPGYRLKTEYRPRCLPLHPALLAQGLWERVEQVRRERGDSAPLFASLTEAQFSQHINAVVHRLKKTGVIVDEPSGPRKTFYSHRHSVITALDGRKILDDEGREVDASYIVGGHSPPDVHKAHYVHVTMARLYKAIETLSAPAVTA